MGKIRASASACRVSHALQSGRNTFTGRGLFRFLFCFVFAFQLHDLTLGLGSGSNLNTCGVETTAGHHWRAGTPPTPSQGKI